MVGFHVVNANGSTKSEFWYFLPLSKEVCWSIFGKMTGNVVDIAFLDVRTSHPHPNIIIAQFAWNESAEQQDKQFDICFVG